MCRFLREFDKPQISLRLDDLGNVSSFWITFRSNNSHWELYIGQA